MDRMISPWWDMLKDRPIKLAALLEVMRIAVQHFEYAGIAKITTRQQAATTTIADTKRIIEERYSSVNTRTLSRALTAGSQGPATATATASSAPSLPTAAAGGGTLSWRRQLNAMGRALEADRGDRDVATLAHLEARIATEATITIIDLMERFFDTCSDLLEEEDGHNVLIERSVQLILECLRTNQAQRVVGFVFATLKGYLYSFPWTFFHASTELCAEVVEEALRLCSSTLPAVRGHATAFLYLLMRKNFEVTQGSFSRVKVQATMALSRLVGGSQQVRHVELQRSFSAIAKYAFADVPMSKGNFPTQVHDLALRLYTILRDTIRMRMNVTDHDMLIDLHYRIAKSYANSPDLRITWLENMTASHMRQGNYAEAAMCVVHQAALVAEYLYMLEYSRAMPEGCSSFQRLSPNVLEESAISDDVQSADEEGICESHWFSVKGLTSLIESACELLEKVTARALPPAGTGRHAR